MRRTLMLFTVAAAGLVLVLLSENEGGRAREPAPRRTHAPLPEADVSCAAPAEAVPETANVAIAGRVTDGQGRPFAGARVRLFRGRDPERWLDAPPPFEDPVSTFRADREGRFAVTARSDTPWLVIADALGFVPAVETVRQGAGRSDCALVLVPPARTSLRVVDREGKPLADAEALVFQKEETLRAAAHADARGRIDVDLAPKELLVLRAPGCTWELLDPPLDAPEVVLEREYRLGGVVELADGTPVAGVRISFDRYLWREEVVTGDDGSFLAGGFGEGEVELTVTPRDRWGQRITVQPGDERLRIVLPTARVEGTVVLPDGRPAAGAHVSANRCGTNCDENGRFAMSEVAPGATRIEAALPEAYAGSMEVTVGAGSVTGVRIALVATSRPRSFVRLSVVDPLGAPVASEGSFFLGEEGKRWWQLGPGGGVIDIGRPPGTEIVLFGGENSAAPRALTASGAVHAVTDASPDGPVVLLRLGPPVIVTLVCMEADGTALRGDVETRLDLLGIDSRELEGSGRGTHRLALRAGDPRSGMLEIRAAGHAPLRIARWKPPPKGGDVEIRLEPAVRITGRVLDPEPGAPGPPRIEFVGDSSFDERDPSGRFRFDTVPGSTVFVVAAKGEVPGFARRIEVPAKGTVDLGSVVLETPWTLRGVVVDESGALVGGAIVTVRGPGYERGVATRGDGTFELLSPPSDLFVVKVEKGARSAEEAPASSFLRGAPTIRIGPWRRGG